MDEEVDFWERVIVVVIVEERVMVVVERSVEETLGSGTTPGMVLDDGSGATPTTVLDDGSGATPATLLDDDSNTTPGTLIGGCGMITTPGVEVDWLGLLSDCEAKGLQSVRPCKSEQHDENKSIELTCSGGHILARSKYRSK
jgi:hypothetical protein